MSDKATGSYTGTAKLLHWVIAFCVIAAIPMGIAMLRVGSGPLQNQLFDLHRSFGALILGLMALRIIWRLFHKPPPLDIELAPAQRFAAGATHILLYVLLLAIPLGGWIGTNMYPAQISVFGLFTLPALTGADREMSETVLWIHGWAGFAVGGLILMHIGAALHHHFIRKDGLLNRMLPGKQTPDQQG
ncbi:cytochrome b [Alphaproteobacteria bacterium HT1-32]|nr:cytochrome b [Alphaproteobacteria bacterium HT1-32]